MLYKNLKISINNMDNEQLSLLTDDISFGAQSKYEQVFQSILGVMKDVRFCEFSPPKQEDGKWASVLFCGVRGARIFIGAKVKRIEFFDTIAKNPTSVQISDDFDYNSIAELADKTWRYCLKRAPVTKFGCCNAFSKCSDEKRCLLSDDLDYYAGCYYRENLESGRIFYGINRNVD